MAPMPPSEERLLVWLDLEMTGLEPDRDVIMEIATVVTDSDLNVLAEGPCLAVHQPDAVLDTMDPWCIEQHGKSGLTQRCRESKVSALDAQARTLEFLAKWCAPGKSPLCGNTIGQDRRFLVKYMPRLHDFFHYRSIDVSSIKELVSSLGTSRPNTSIRRRSGTSPSRTSRSPSRSCGTTGAPSSVRRARRSQDDVGP